MLTILESMDKRTLTIDCAATFHHIMTTEQKRERSWSEDPEASLRGEQAEEILRGAGD